MVKNLLIDITTWETPATAYPDKHVGRARLKTGHYNKGGIYHCNHQGPEGPDKGYDFFRCLKRITIKSLEINGKTWMVDDPSHWWSIIDLAGKYRGHVLVAGLGLGLVVHALTANLAVDHITVVERSKDVIKLVQPLVPQAKLEIICGDWYKFDITDRFDGIFFDLFVGDGQDLLDSAIEEYGRLQERLPGKLINVFGFPRDMLEVAMLSREAILHFVEHQHGLIHGRTLDFSAD